MADAADVALHLARLHARDVAVRLDPPLAVQVGRRRSLHAVALLLSTEHALLVVSRVAVRHHRSRLRLRTVEARPLLLH